MHDHCCKSTDDQQGTRQQTSEQGKWEGKSETGIQAQHGTVLQKVSQRKIEANRRNAQKSTGPKTSRGKAAVRFNALKHGLLAEQILLAASVEERSLVERVLKGVYDHFEPVGYLEAHCVEELAVCLLKNRRALRWEIFQQRQAPPLISFESKVLVANARAKLRQLLMDRQVNERKDTLPDNSELSPKSSVTAHSEDQLASPNAVGEPIPPGDSLSTIIRYGTANDRKFHRMIVYLERLQRERKGEYVPAPISVSVEA